MQLDSFVDSVDSLITKGTQTSARVEFRETSGWGSRPVGRESLPRVTSSQSGISFGLVPLPGWSLPEKPNRCQSNSATCADIKHYCILTFRMDCNSAFSWGNLKKALCLCAVWGLVQPSHVTSFHSVTATKQKKKGSFHLIFQLNQTPSSRSHIISPDTAVTGLNWCCGDFNYISHLNWNNFKSCGRKHLSILLL